MNFKLFLITLSLIIPFLKINAQDSLRISKNQLYLEGGGGGGYGSLNYERLLFNSKRNLKLGIRSGIGTYRIKDFKNKFNPDIIIPVSVNVYYGRIHHAELDFGQTLSSMVYANNTDLKIERRNSLNANFGAGYRYQKNERGIFLRMAYTPFLEQWIYFRHWWGISIGYSL